MPITTIENEVARLRKYLNPYIQGPNTSAVLYALASGNSSYLINNVAAVNDSLYIATASGIYLDLRLAEAQIVRPPSVGLSDDVFREIGIQVKNRKQVRDLMDNILDAIFGDEFVRANSSSAAFEPYNLEDGDTLIINFDENHTVTIIFNTEDFESIGAAKAQEVADAITKSLRNQNLTGTAIAKNNGNGGFVELLSDTIGPASSVTVLGGSAQNELLFAAPVSAGGNMSTQWTISVRPGGILRFTWSGGANPMLGRLEVGNYVNIFGGGFTSSANEGSYTITNSQGGPSGTSFFEVSNPLGTSGIVVQGIDNAVLFYNPIKKLLSSNFSYAAIYQVQSRMLQIFLPATTQVIRRNRAGSAHVHYPPNGTFTFNANPNPGDQFSITTSTTFIAGVDFVIGGTIVETINNFVIALNALTGIIAMSDSDNIGNIENDPGNVNGVPSISIVNIFSQIQSLLLTIIYTGSANIVASGPLGDPLSLAPNQPGPYSYDLTQPFVVGSISTLLNQELDASSARVIQVDDSSQFPDAQGYIILGYGTEEQEGPIPYIARPSNTTLLLSPVYTIKTSHPAGTSVFIISLKAPVILDKQGLDYQFYVTDVVSGRIYAQDLIQSVAATGINVVFTILYPGDIGLSKWSTKYSEISYVYGP